MTEIIPERMNDKQYAHVKYFIIFTISYFLADIITLIFNRKVPQLFQALGRLFQDLTLPLFVVLLTLIFARGIVSIFPELSLTQRIPLYVVIIPPLIVSHPLLISFSGSTLTVAWLVLDIFAENRGFNWLLELLVFGFSGYALFMVQYRTKSRSSRIAQILRYLGKEIFLSMIVIISSVYLLLSFISESYESLTLTMPVKLVLITLFAFGSLPISRDENENKEIQEIDKTDIRADIKDTDN